MKKPYRLLAEGNGGKGIRRLNLRTESTPGKGKKTGRGGGDDIHKLTWALTQLMKRSRAVGAVWMGKREPVSYGGKSRKNKNKWRRKEKYIDPILNLVIRDIKLKSAQISISKGARKKNRGWGPPKEGGG